MSFITSVIVYFLIAVILSTIIAIVISLHEDSEDKQALAEFKSEISKVSDFYPYYIRKNSDGGVDIAIDIKQKKIAIGIDDRIEFHEFSNIHNVHPHIDGVCFDADDEGKLFVEDIDNITKIKKLSIEFYINNTPIEIVVYKENFSRSPLDLIIPLDNLRIWVGLLFKIEKEHQNGL